jgi:hypothetical protein
MRMRIAAPLMRIKWPARSLGIAAIMAAVLPPTASQLRAAESIRVVLDQARIAKIPEQTATIVVGNPLIADVSVQTGNTMVVTGKGYGITNVIALDHAGNVLAEESVRVTSPADSVVVYRGIARESYSCSPYCERRITLGDVPEFFDAALTQTGNRNARAQVGQNAVAGGAPPPPPH